MQNLNSAQVEKSIKIPIVPSPKILNLDKDLFKIKDNLKISLLSDSPDKITFSAKQIQNTLREFLSIDSKINDKNPDIILSIKKEADPKIPKEFSDEGYVLRISNKEIKIESTTPKGIFYGTMSLVQLLEKAENLKLQSMEIVDWPDMKVRGISDDISRGQVSTLDNFKRIIKFIARYKMNTYMPYLEDMLKFDKYPSIGNDRGALTKQEVKELVSYADKYFIEIIPIFQTLGHYENILYQKEFLKYAEFPGAASLNVSSDSTYIFLDNLLKEVFELFPSKYFHMGADESYDVGLGKSKFLVNKFGIAKVHADHYKKIYELAKKYHKKLMMYGDIILRHPEILSLIPKDITIVDWHYRPYDYFPSTKIFKDAGFNYYVSPSVWNFLTTFPTNVNALPNIKYFIKSGLENGSTGMINSNWGDYGAETFKEFVLYGYAWSAQCSWNFKKSDINEFSDNYFYDFFGIKDERLKNIYTALSNSFNQIVWNEVWRHPLLNNRTSAWWEPHVSKTATLNWMEWTLPETEESIKELRNKVKKNKDHFDLLDFIIKLNHWYETKIKTESLLHLMKDSLAVNKSDSAVNLINLNISSLKNLKTNFDELWLKYYKKDNLNRINDKFDRLISYFKEIKDFLQNGDDTLYSPLIKSEWIYVKKNDSTFADSAEFKTTINLSAKPDTAFIQLMGDTYARLFINDKYVDEVFAKRSGSLFSEYKRIKFLEVLKYLKPGENEIVVKAQNFYTNGAAGFNISSYIKVKDEIFNVDTHDSSSTNNVTWKASTGNNIWENVVAKDYPHQIIAPNFKTKRTSWIER